MADFTKVEAWSETEAQFEQPSGLETLMAAWGHTSWDLQGEKRDGGSWGSPLPICPFQKLPEHPSLASLPLCLSLFLMSFKQSGTLCLVLV